MLLTLCKNIEVFAECVIAGRLQVAAQGNI